MTAADFHEPLSIYLHKYRNAQQKLALLQKRRLQLEVEVGETAKEQEEALRVYLESLGREDPET